MKGSHLAYTKPLLFSLPIVSTLVPNGSHLAVVVLLASSQVHVYLTFLVSYLKHIFCPVKFCVDAFLYK